MKKLTTLLLILVLALSSVFSLVGCNEEQGGSNSSPAEQAKFTLALNEYDLNLDIGETFALTVKKFDENGVEQQIKQVSYQVEASAVASVSESGVITAKGTGKTYVNVTADGVDIAAFLTVNRIDNLNGLVIRFTTQKLYKGAHVQAYAFIYENGEVLGEPTEVTWAVSDEDKATVSESGVVSALDLTDSLTVTASCTFNGQNYTAEKQLPIVAAYYYSVNNPSVNLATAKTLSGVDNSVDTSKGGIIVTGVNVFDEGESKLLTELEISVDDQEVATAVADENGEVTVTANKAGVTNVNLIDPVTNDSVIVKVTVYTAISTIADMDILAYASLLNTELLAGRYALVNDIDYAGQVILPIASVNQGGTRKVGMQWKHWLTKTEDSYAPVARENVGKADVGLTAEQFTAFANAKGINPATTPFTGTFDGNGYSIKSAAMFYGSYMYVSGTTARPYYGTGIFGYLSGTLQNISFEDITIQLPSDPINGNTLTFADSAYTLHQDGDGYYLLTGMSIVSYSVNSTIKNVYANIDYNVKFSGNYCKAVLTTYMQTSSVSNCVIECDKLYQTNYAISSSYAPTGDGTISNCFAIGVSRFSKNYTKQADAVAGGNYYLGSGKTWADLAATTVASAQLTVAQVAATYDTSVWDMSKFNTTDGGRPALIKGCTLG